MKESWTVEATRDLDAARLELGNWLDQDSVEQAIVTYYLLHHPAGRTRLYLHRNPVGELSGALAECVTGYDLFRPLIIMAAHDDDTLRALVREAIPRNRPCLVLGPLHYAPIWAEYFDLTEEAICRLYALEPATFEPIINVLVTSGRTPDGLPRYEIRSREKVMAYAGLNWGSPRFAEVSVFTEPEARGRRWGESVVSALCAELLHQGLRPVYLTDESNEASRRLAERVGFRETGRRLMFATAIWGASAGSPASR